MPRIKSAKKKLRKDKKRTIANLVYKTGFKKIITSLKGLKGKGSDKRQQGLTKAYSLIDKAAKKGIIHKNKAARLKSKAQRLAK